MFYEKDHPIGVFRAYFRVNYRNIHHPIEVFRVNYRNIHHPIEVFRLNYRDIHHPIE